MPYIGMYGRQGYDNNLVQRDGCTSTISCIVCERLAKGRKLTTKKKNATMSII
jgi:hypothetical protein